MRGKAVVLALLLSTRVLADQYHTPRPMPGALPMQPSPPTRKNVNCGESDYRMDEPEGSMAGLPPRFQKSSGMCGSEATADLIDAWAMHHPAPSGYVNPDHRHSPIMAAIAQSASAGETTVGGGRIPGIYNYVRSHGSCDQAALAKDGTPGGANARYDAFNDQFLDIYDWIYDEWDKVKEKGELKIPDAAVEMACKMRSSSFAHGVVDDFNGITGAFYRAKITELFKDIFLSACDGHIEKPELPELKKFEVDLDNPGRVSSELKKIFNANPKPQPIAMDFCSKVLYQGYAFSPLSRSDQDERNKQWNSNEECRRHLASIIGMRWNKKKHQCEFLLRNWWGIDCDGHKGSGLDCEKTTGYIWLSDELIDASAQSIFHLN